MYAYLVLYLIDLQVRSQWYNQKPLHRLFIQNQINKLLDKIIED